MLLLVFLLVAFFWMMVGAVQFLVCVVILPLRRYALSAALWWAAWGPCSIGLIMFAGVAFVAQAFITKDGDSSRFHLPHLSQILWSGYLVLALLMTVIIATVIAWLHQAIVRRFPFVLFRLYATVISGGIGSVFGWCFEWWLQNNNLKYKGTMGGVSMLLLVAGFGLAAYKNARSLRGTAPQKFVWVTQDEFEGA